MLRRTLLTSALLTATIVPGTGCWMDSGSGTPLIEAEDVRMEPPGTMGFRQLGDKGEVYGLALDVSDDVNHWVTDIAVGMSKLVHELDQHPATREEGDWRVYGPQDDEDGRDGAWMVKITGDSAAASFEVYIGRRGASEEQMRLLISGDVSVVESERDGRFTIDFDTIRELEDLIDGVNADADYGGKITVSFERNADTLYKRVELDFDGFYADDGEDDLDFDGESYLYHREDDGAGRFHFATWSSFEGEWSGPALERMTVDMRWDADEAGRAQGSVVEVDGVGDLRHGDLTVAECFDGNGGLTWRSLDEPYLGYEPDYAFGDEKTCVFGESDMIARE
ncbi:MAG: hypothetical protein H6712_14060 [Myxococcales bacterium]|nr:hypothetical protein [Myxococcales bacterium]MCB9714987.1 hypothetical protein [Myxococcales bacterium]